MTSLRSPAPPPIRLVLLAALLALPGLCTAACSDARAAAGSTACKQRVVSLHDVTTEAVVELGAAQCLVGVAEPTDLSAEVRAQLASVPRVASAETVLAQKPSLVLGLDIVREHEPALVQALARRGVPFHAPKLEQLADVRALVEHTASAIDRKAQAASWLSRFDRIKPTGERSRRVLVFDCCAPPFTAGKHALLTDLLAQAGAQNVFADVDDTWFHTSWEAAVARKPELIIIDDYGAEGGLAEKRAMLERVAPLKGLPIVVVPLRDVLGSIRTPEVVERLARELTRAGR